MPPKIAESRVYRLSPPRRYAFWFFAGPLLLVFGLVLLLVPIGRDSAVVFVLMAMLAAGGLGLQWWLSRIRLELSPEQVRVKQMADALETPWSNVIGIRLDRGREGFITRDPMEGRGAANLAALRGLAYNGVPTYDEPQRDLMAQRRLIPFDGFAWHARHGNLLADIARYAPHLKADCDAGPRPALARTPQQRRENWYVVAGILIGAPALIAAMLNNRVWPFVLAALVLFGALRSALSARNSFLNGAKVLGLICAVGALMFGIFGLAQIAIAIRCLIPR